ncbi:MAG: sodium:calcium antiporter [Halobacteriaceae archaeon]
MRRQSKIALTLAFGLTVPWVLVELVRSVLPPLLSAVGVAFTAPAGLDHMAAVPTVIVSGLSVLGAAFLLAWAAETAEKDVPRAFAIAVLAVLAVAPEYAVGALYAWNAGLYAGTERGAEAANLVIANMTGANRLLIGIGWAGIALFTIYRHGSSEDPAVESRNGFLASVVTLDRDIGLDVVFLLAATLWAFFVPFNGGIDILDTVLLVGLYVAYILVVLRGDVDPEEEHVGVPASLQQFHFPKRVATVVFLFAYSGLMIFTAVEPFAHGLEVLGKAAGVPSFFMIQWIAPLASESPELIVVLYLVNKARSTAGFNALISSKLNQWTLLIGTFAVVYSLSLGQYAALPFHAKQSAEIWLTAAQSYFAISVLLNFEISVREAITLLVLFVSQVVLEFLIIKELIVLPVTSLELLLVFAAIYVVLGTALFIRRRQAARRLVTRVSGTIATALGRDQPSPRSADD